MKVYVASSWRNEKQPEVVAPEVVAPEVVAVLRALGHEVYDFRHPAPGSSGLSWGACEMFMGAWVVDSIHKLVEVFCARGAEVLK